MKSQTFSGGVVLRLDRGEMVTGTLEDFLNREEIRGGTVTGLGGVEKVELGYYDLASRTYRRKRVEGIVELVTYSGNISVLDGRSFIHAHAVVSGPDFTPFSGHFFDARVALTGEFIIRPASWSIERRHDDATGLNLMNL
jgi:predicted DNA-binding protein with PD1-like motif